MSAVGLAQSPLGLSNDQRPHTIHHLPFTIHGFQTLMNIRLRYTSDIAASQTSTKQTANIAETFSRGSRRERRKWPVSTPMRVVASAPVVLTMPSGSYRGFHVCLPKTPRST